MLGRQKEVKALKAQLAETQAERDQAFTMVRACSRPESASMLSPRRCRVRPQFVVIQLTPPSPDVQSGVKSMHQLETAQNNAEELMNSLQRTEVSVGKRLGCFRARFAVYPGASTALHWCPPILLRV